MKVCISYASSPFRQTQLVNKHSALRIGNFDKYIDYSPRDIDADFKRKNKHILQQKGGAGSWLWKPYIIHKTLMTLTDEDILVYMDAGTLLLRSFDAWAAFMQRKNINLVPFVLPSHKEQYWMKRDAFVLMDCDTPVYTNTRQRLAGYHSGGGHPPPQHFWRNGCIMHKTNASSPTNRIHAVYRTIVDLESIGMIKASSVY